MAQEKIMTKLLQINSGIRLNGSNTRTISQMIVERWKLKNTSGEVVIRDLVNNPVPHLDELTLDAFYTPPEKQSLEMKEAIQESDELVNEFLDADVIVIGAPVYNLGIPSTLKSYFDHIVRVGKTFQYSANGPKGLVTGKKVYIVTARGSFRNPELDTHGNFLVELIQFFGITDIEVIHAEGLAISDESRENSLKKAEATISELIVV